MILSRSVDETPPEVQFSRKLCSTSISESSLTPSDYAVTRGKRAPVQLPVCAAPPRECGPPCSTWIELVTLRQFSGATPIRSAVDSLEALNIRGINDRSQMLGMVETEYTARCIAVMPVQSSPRRLTSCFGRKTRKISNESGVPALP